MEVEQITTHNFTDQKLFDFTTKYPDITRLIFDYILVNEKDIIFVDKPYNSHDINYNNCYQISLEMDNYYLSRIYKPNGLHRYYITSYTIESCCNCCGEYDCTNRNCRSYMFDEYTYKSKYVGKNLRIAIFKFCELAKCTSKINLIR